MRIHAAGLQAFKLRFEQLFVEMHYSLVALNALFPAIRFLNGGIETARNLSLDALQSDIRRVQPDFGGLIQIPSLDVTSQRHTEFRPDRPGYKVGALRHFPGSARVEAQTIDPVGGLEVQLGQ